MKFQIVANGRERLNQSDVFKARLRELRATIRTKYAAKIEDAGILRRWSLRVRMFVEYRRERRRILPSLHSLYGSPIANIQRRACWDS